ncbi:hypothetical protein RSO41_06130 [Halomonas sp. I1]|uniref:hypothetical protein n=1 Tax=Halomonas sp. I1 TaxID=393536 RepID=UPI0028DDC5B2|nr:hypothetical protein [Halomonas sp. I1]MDT8894228.1 hypothetical protein [Halomonas sp. I1]
MNTAVKFPQFDPDQPDRDEHRRQVQAEYLNDWINGNLYDDGGVYSGPLEKMAEDDRLVQLLTAKDDEQLLQVAKMLRGQLRQSVETQADMDDAA